MSQLDLSKMLTTEIREPIWIVESIIPASTIVLVAGDPGVGKSVMNLCEGMHIALGLPFLDCQTRQTRVLYFDEENSFPDLSAYVQQLWIGMGQPDPDTLSTNFKLEHFSLGRHDWPTLMANIIKREEPGMIYIDTATSALAIKQENENAEAHAVVQLLRHMIPLSPSQPSIKIMKHAKYQNSGGTEGSPRRTIRGAKAWLGAVDQTMFHIRAGAGRPRDDGLHPTILVPDKSRAFGLKRNILITPAWTNTTPNGLILKGETHKTSKDLMVIG